jgi:DNA-binding NarL/FixJ family response regulator
MRGTSSSGSTLCVYSGCVHRQRAKRARGRGARAAVAETRPDVLLTAIRMPPTHTDEGVALAAELADTAPDVAVVLLSRFLERSYATRLFGSATDRRGYLSKTRLTEPDYLVEVLRRVANGIPVVDPAVVERVVEADPPRQRSLSDRSVSPRRAR